MNLLACSAYWNSLPRSTPHSWWSETWSVFIPNCSKGCPGTGAQNWCWRHVREQQEASYGREADARASADLMAALPTVSCGRAANRNADAWSVEMGGSQSRKTVAFHTEPLEGIWARRSFKTIKQDLIKAVNIKVARMTPETIFFSVK